MSLQTTDRPRVLICPVCHSETFGARFEIKGIRIEACDRCGLVLQNPQPTDRELAAIYGIDYFIGASGNDQFAQQFELVKRATARLQLDEIAAYLTEHGRSEKKLRLLEVGCGHGNMLYEARARGFLVEGLEYSVDAAQRANDNLGAEVVRVGAVGETALPEKSYDICILADVIEHVRDPENFLRHISRILKDDAVIFIATPSTDSWSARALGRQWMEFKPEHLFYFSRETIQRLLASAGFSDITITTGRKMLTLDYIIGHFEKFPTPVISPSLRIVRALAPDALLGKLWNVTASGINAFATKR
jgi:2-polyprenyl-3-methyl-5-hydroxy-6-metoxy-1,4-benzoquinol methylase